MVKNTRIVLGIIIFLLVIGAACAIYYWTFRTCCAPPLTQSPLPSTINGPTRTQRLADPNLLYASSWWAGLCANDKGEGGGCLTDLYLYNSGTLVKDSGFQRVNSSDEERSSSESQLKSDSIDSVIKMIKDSNIMTKNCPAQNIMDVGWDYQINLEGTKKSFHNPPEDCKMIFSQIDDFIKSTSTEKQ